MRASRGGACCAAASCSGLSFVLPFIGTFLLMPYALPRRIWRVSRRRLAAPARGGDRSSAAARRDGEPQRSRDRFRAVKLTRRQFVATGAAALGAAAAGCDRPKDLADDLRRWMGHPAAPPLEGPFTPPAGRPARRRLARAEPPHFRPAPRRLRPRRGHGRAGFPRGATRAGDRSPTTNASAWCGTSLRSWRIRRATFSRFPAKRTTRCSSSSPR